MCSRSQDGRIGGGISAYSVEQDDAAEFWGKPSRNQNGDIKRQSLIQEKESDLIRVWKPPKARKKMGWWGWGVQHKPGKTQE